MENNDGTPHVVTVKDVPVREAEVSRPTRDLVTEAIAGAENEPVRRNVAFWIDIRNCVAHRYLPAVDASVIPWAQAGLLDFESVLEEWPSRSSST